MIQTMCIYAGSRGSPLEYRMFTDDDQVYVLTLSMTSDAGHAVNMSVRGKATTDIPMVNLSSSSSSIVQGQVLLHNLLNATKLMNGSTMTLYMTMKGIYQKLLLPYTPYVAHVFHVNVPNIDPDSFS